MEMPEWAEDFDNGQRSLDYSLDEASGSWDYVVDVMRQEVAV